MLRRIPIGEMLVGQGRIDGIQLTSALAYQKRWGGRLGNALVALGFVSELDVLAVVGRQLGVAFVQINNRTISPSILRLIPEKLIRSRRVLPLALLSRTQRGPLVVAMSEPANLTLIDEIAFAAGMEIKPVLAGEADIEHAIARHLDGTAPIRMDPIDLPDEHQDSRVLMQRPRRRIRQSI